jgi:3-hydroxyethyl bacteriochlorophyllide a dehydrogenase
LGLRRLELRAPTPADVVVETRFSGISTGTERLLWSGRMPPFPGMGYPLVPGYESVGEVVEAGAESGLSVGQHVFVPGASCYKAARGLFGGAAGRLIVPGARVVPIDAQLGEEGVLIALAATAYHAIAAGRERPGLIVGHGTLGRLIARITLALGAPPPTVWETNPGRHGGAAGYAVVQPDDDARRDYGAIYDASGAPGLLNKLIARLSHAGEIVLAGFYEEPVSFVFPPAFMKEARLRIAAEWTPQDLAATRALIESGQLDLSGLITHHEAPGRAAGAYETAFNDPACLKMVLDWRDAA